MLSVFFYLCFDLFVIQSDIDSVVLKQPYLDGNISCYCDSYILSFIKYTLGKKKISSKEKRSSYEIRHV